MHGQGVGSLLDYMKMQYDTWSSDINTINVQSGSPVNITLLVYLKISYGTVVIMDLRPLTE